MDAFWKLWAAFLSAATGVGQFAKTAWEITFGKVIVMYSLPFWSLPLLEQLIYVAVMIAIVVTLTSSLWRLWGRVRNLLGAIVSLVVAIFIETPQLLIVLVLAIVAAWVITTFNLDVGLPNLQTLWHQLQS